MMNVKEEQRICVKFCVKLKKTFTETFQMLREAFGDECLSRSRCHEWYGRFKEGRTSSADNPRSGRPTTSTDDAHVAEVNTLVRANRRLTVRELAEECKISFGACQEILTEKLKMRRLIRDFCTKNGMTVLPQPPYSPDLAPADFFLFPKLKYPLKGKRFHTIDEIQEKSLMELSTISEEAFSRCFLQWKHRWEKCIASHGEYFEGDNVK
ncbi:protein GVQW3-like [Osmia bicornis bicornis]|uniref:protein GVQW3-like n=1 Tax=Osmia bicornis bicornis TaxID=1437191 RepID=UPI001EAF69E9|nr:protein GVQW3-like [Osmia bicornis bicornis]